MRVLLLSLCACCALGAFGEKQPYARYKSIVDRQMFGQPPPDFDPTRSPNEVQKTSAAAEKQLTAEQAKLQSAVHFSVINELSDGETAVGFTDNSDPKQPKHYYLKVGESQDGWKVAEADPEKATMTLVKGEIELEMTLGDKSAGAKAPSGAPAGGAATPRGGFAGGGLQSLRARREQRRQQEATQRAEAERRAADAKAEADALAAEREAQRQAQEAQRQAQLEETRTQLKAMQEEMRKSREAAAAREKEKKSDEGDEE